MSSIKSLSFDENGHAIFTFIDGNGETAVLDLTNLLREESTKAADAAVAEHMRKWHSQNL